MPKLLKFLNNKLLHYSIGSVNKLLRKYEAPVITPIEYGALYNWYAASKNGGTGVGSIAPDGWHVPSKAEFETLIGEVGGTLIAGRSLKIAGTEYYNTPNLGATNSSGFSMVGAGERDLGGGFSQIGIEGTLWTMDSFDATRTWIFVTNYNNEGAWMSVKNKIYGQPIRLIKNDSTNTGSVTDYDGNIYPTVKIGDQVWMAANLAVEHFKDGTLIPNITDNGLWAADTAGAMCYYDNDINNK